MNQNTESSVIAPSTSFGLRTVEELHEALINIAAPRLHINPPSTFDCACFAVFSWSILKDWLAINEKSSLRGEKARMIALENDKRLSKDHPIRLFCFMLRDLANGSKHQKLDERNQKKTPIDYVQTGNRGTWSDYLWKRGALTVNLNNGMFFGAPAIARITTDILNWVMNDSEPLDVLPGEAITEIWLSKKQHQNPQVPLPNGALPLPVDHPQYVYYCAQQGIAKDL